MNFLKSNITYRQVDFGIQIESLNISLMVERNPAKVNGYADTLLFHYIMDNLYFINKYLFKIGCYRFLILYLRYYKKMY